uniref:Uncharacterized protein n=1 Tax=Rhizophora mucronata TaxID=61149 RepID=A0A2P2JGX0_RHIMU
MPTFVSVGSSFCHQFNLILLHK